MKMNVYTIYDAVALESGPLFTSKNDGTAARACMHLLSGVVNLSGYKLYHVGVYYPETMILSPSEPAREVDFIGLIPDAMLGDVAVRPMRSAYVEEA